MHSVQVSVFLQVKWLLCLVVKRDAIVLNRLLTHSRQSRRKLIDTWTTRDASLVEPSQDRKWPPEVTIHYQTLSYDKIWRHRRTVCWVVRVITPPTVKSRPVCSCFVPKTFDSVWWRLSPTIRSVATGNKWWWCWFFFPRLRGLRENVRPFIPRLRSFLSFIFRLFSSPACVFSFFFVEIISRRVIPLFTPSSVHSGSASWDDCDQLFPDKLRVSSFRIGSHTILLSAQR